MKLLCKLLLAAFIISLSANVYAALHFAIKTDSTTRIDRQLPAFSSIRIAGPFEVHIIQGTTESIKYELPADVVGRVITEVEDGVLKIRNKHDNWGWGYDSWYSEKSVWRNHKKIVVFVSAKKLDGLSVSGSGHAIFNEGIASQELSLRTSGSGDIVGKIEVKTLWSHISGSGSIKLSGTAESSTVKVSGSGNFSSRNLLTANSTAHVSGSGRVEINASDKIDAIVHGSGGVNYTGSAKNVYSSTSGSGVVSRF